MSLLSTLFGGLFGNSSNGITDCPTINPASGLPIMNCSVDVEGNPYGTNMSDYDHNLTTNSLFNDDNHNISLFDDDSWSSSSSNSWDD